MKKSIIAISLAGLMALLQACGGDGHKEANCSVDQYQAGCKDGLYLHCEYNDEAKMGDGHVVESATIEIDRVVYVCNDQDKLVPKDSGSVTPRPNPGKDAPVCKDGMIEGMSANMAVIDNVLYKCNGNDIESANCDADFKNGCYGDSYISCKDGTMSQQDRVTIENMSYVCRDNSLVVDVKCENDRFVDFNSHFLTVHDVLFACNGNKVSDVSSQYNSACDDTSRYYFDAADGEFKVENCATNAMICEEYQRGEMIYAACVNKNDVQDGCDTASFYGNCDGNTLIICTSKEKSKGKLLKINCKQQAIPKSCKLVEDDYGYDCVIECKDEDGKDYTDFGSCDGNILGYCSQNGEFNDAECANGCGFNGAYNDCM